MASYPRVNDNLNDLARRIADNTAILAAGGGGGGGAVSSVSAGTGISIPSTTGAVVVTNSGVTSNVSGTGISVSAATGAVTITNTGVTSLLGTSNRVTASAGTGAVTIDIAATYVGQASITTLGTITTGTWNASVIGSTKGGAGAVNGILKADGAGTVTAAVAGTDYLSGTGSTNIVTLGTVTTGTWSATAIATAKGGLGADNSASNGVPLFATGVVTMTSTSGTGNFARVTSPTFVTPVLGAATATSYTLTNGGAITDGATGAVTIAAAGTNQNVNLTTSGTGQVVITATNNADNCVLITNAANLASIAVSRTSGRFVRVTCGTVFGSIIYDSSSSGYLSIASATTITAAATERFRFTSGGRMLCGTTSDPSNGILAFPNSTASSDGIQWGPDVNSYRSAVGVLRVTNTLSVSTSIIIETSNAPATASSTGTTGTVAWDAGNIYVCIATNTWKRIAITTF